MTAVGLVTGHLTSANMSVTRCLLKPKVQVAERAYISRYTQLTSPEKVGVLLNGIGIQNTEILDLTEQNIVFICH